MDGPEFLGNSRGGEGREIVRVQGCEWHLGELLAVGASRT